MGVAAEASLGPTLDRRQYLQVGSYGTFFGPEAGALTSELCLPTACTASHGGP